MKKEKDFSTMHKHLLRRRTVKPIILDVDGTRYPRKEQNGFLAYNQV